MKNVTKVLLVEDDAWLAELEAATLREVGYAVTVSPHALAAIDAIDTQLPDVIVLDVLLPGSTAFALLNELQSYEDTRRIPIVLCTNLAEQFSESDLQNYGVQRVVNKTTMEPSDIVAAVRAVVAVNTVDSAASAATDAATNTDTATDANDEIPRDTRGNNADAPN